MLKDYLTFDFGESFFRDQKVIDLVLDKMPVSISLGLWTTLLVYLISIPPGIRKAIKDGSQFDITSSTIITIGYAIPSFLFAIILIVFFAGGRYYDIFPLRGLVSENFEEQVVQVLNNIKGILIERNCELSDIVKLTIYLVDLSKFDSLNKIFENFFFFLYR